MASRAARWAAVAAALGVAVFLIDANGADVSQCKVQPFRSDALDYPSRHAWNLFVLLNHPAVDKRVERGQADCSKPFGAPGTTAVWETWRNAATEVYLQDGREPPVWSDTSLPDEKPGVVPLGPAVGVASFHSMAVNAATKSNKSRAGQAKPLFSPEDGVFNDAGGFGETRMNRATYEFVRSECLFSSDGLQRYAAAIEAGKKPDIRFPNDAIEVKAAWLDFDKENIPPEKRKGYYTASYKGKSYGLTSLHILTKDVPNWYWATFHHKDAPSNKHEMKDTYGPPPIVRGTVWENYLLGGTQTDFTSPTGKPSVLSDHYVEFNFQNSSCITCHSTASISRNGPLSSGQLKSLCALQPVRPEMGITAQRCRQELGDSAFIQGTDRLVVERGVPDPDWFEVSSKRTYFQTDFVFSIPFRAQKETAPPPQRCIW